MALFQKVYASPSRRRMDTKGELEEMTYPHICFMVDNFDEVWQMGFCSLIFPPIQKFKIDKYYHI